MIKILPLGEPRIETYQGISFILAVLMGYENIKNIYYNNYINMECNATGNIMELELLFTNATWEDYRLAGYADMDMYYIRNLLQDKWDGFIQERIDQGNYIILYSVDEYFLSYTPNFMVNHFIHDTYIYGYDEKTYFVLAYKDKRLQQIMVPHQEITHSLYAQSKYRNNVSFCTFKPSSTINVPIDIEHIKKEYYNYLNAYASREAKKNKVYGTDVYNELEKCILNVINICGEENRKVDLRPFRCIWEHKKVCLERMDNLKGLVKLREEDKSILSELVCISRKIFLLVIKYNQTNDKNILKRSIQYVNGKRLIK